MAALRKPTAADGWAPSEFEKQICEPCIKGSHHCSTKGCECPLCEHQGGED